MEDFRLTIPEVALRLTGFVLGHALWNVSDIPDGELLVPLALTERAGQRELLRFAADSQEVAIRNGKARMIQLAGTVDAWAFARDGVFNETDAITVDFWAKGMKDPATVVQRYEPLKKRGRFKVIGQPVIAIQGNVLGPSEQKEVLPELNKGLLQHTKVAELADVAVKLAPDQEMRRRPSSLAPLGRMFAARAEDGKPPAADVPVVHADLELARRRTKVAMNTEITKIKRLYDALVELVRLEPSTESEIKAWADCAMAVYHLIVAEELDVPYFLHDYLDNVDTRLDQKNYAKGEARLMRRLLRELEQGRMPTDEDLDLGPDDE
jgi:hypothetical protein